MGRHTLYHPDRPATDTERQRAKRARERQLAAGLQYVRCEHISPTCTLYQGDALTIAPLLQDIDALVTDPPYGVGYDFTKKRRTAARWDGNILGDDQPFDPTPWLTYRQIILWGADHSMPRLPAPQGYITWDKRAGGTPDDHAGCELAWSSIPGSSFLHKPLWRGNRRAGEANVARRKKYHPAEKPIELMLKCVEKTTGTVLDPYMGSASTGEACLRLGRPFVGIELDPHWFQVACDRLRAAVRQGRLFPVQHAVG